MQIVMAFWLFFWITKDLTFVVSLEEASCLVALQKISTPQETS